MLSVVLYCEICGGTCLLFRELLAWAGCPHAGHLRPQVQGVALGKGSSRTQLQRKSLFGEGKLCLLQRGERERPEHRVGPPSSSSLGASQVALVVKNLPAKAGDRRDLRLILGSGRSSGGGHGNPLQYSRLEKPVDRGAWQVTAHGIAESDATGAT